MAINVPSAVDVAAKWAAVTPGRQSDYVKGVQGAAAAYQAGVDGAQANWAAGVQSAISINAYQNGVSGKGAFYSQQASTIGATRWGPGVTAAKDRYQAGEARILSAIAAVNLPPKQPRGNPANLTRVGAVVDAERAARFR